jgi:hypothetical protein
MGYQYGLDEIRQACLAPEVRWADPAAQSMWDELRAVANVGAWSSTCLQAGKLLEKHLQQELDAPTRGIARSLQGIARTRSDDATLTSHLHVAGETLRGLRNRSAHPTGEITAKDATLAIVCTLVLHGVAASRPDVTSPRLPSAREVPAEELVQTWHLYAGPTIAQRVLRGSTANAITILEGAGVHFFEHLLRGISPRVLGRLPQRIRACHGDEAAFGEAVLGLLPNVLSALGEGRANGLVRFAANLGGESGLGELRLLLLKIMPFDAEAVRERLSRPGSNIAWQLNQMRRSGHQAALALDEDSNWSADLAIATWKQWDGTLAGANTNFVRARHSPRGLRLQIWSHAPTEAAILHIRGSNKVPGMYRAFGYYLQSAERRSDLPELVEAFLARVSAAGHTEKRQALIALGLCGALGTTAGARVASELLNSIAYDRTLDSIRVMATAGLHRRALLRPHLRRWLPYAPDEVMTVSDLLLIGWAAILSEVTDTEVYSLNRFFVPSGARFAYDGLARLELGVAFLGLETLEPGESRHTPECWEALIRSAPSNALPRAAAWLAEHLEDRGFPLPQTEASDGLPMPK